MSQRGVGAGVIKSIAGIVCLILLSMLAFAAYSPTEPSHGTLYTNIIEPKTSDEIDIRTQLLISGGSNLLISEGSIGIGTDDPGAKLDINTANVPLLVQKWYGSGGRYYGIENYDNRLILADLGVRRILEYDPAGWISLGGNVGIGTTSPSQTLNVKGTANLSDTDSFASLYFGSDNNGQLEFKGTSPYLDFKNDDSDFDMRLKLTSDDLLTLTGGNVEFQGKVGIGTATPVQPLHVFGEKGIRLQSSAVVAAQLGFVNSIDNLHLTQNAYFDGSAWKSIAASPTKAGGFQTNLASSEAFRVIADTSVAAADETLSLAPLLVVKTDGSVGIGTSSPSHTLNVKGTVNLSDTDSFASLYFGIDDPGQLEFKGTAPYLDFKNDDSDFDMRLQLTSNDLLTLAGGNVEFQGSVGIGTTTPIAALDVRGSGIFSTGFVNFTNNTAFNQTLYMVNGNVGIGTTSPTAKLDVAGTVKATSFEGSFAGVGSVPQGAVMFFDKDTCPTGWSEFAGAQGRVVVGISGASAKLAEQLNGEVGTDLALKGTRTITTVPAHTHSVTIDPPSTATSSDGAHRHTYNQPIAGGSANGGGNGRFTVADSADTGSAGAHDHTVNIAPITATSGSTGSSSVDVTMPYIQLLVCRKD